MEFNDYQERASQFALYPEKYRVAYPMIGLFGEAGEVANKVGKILRDKNGTASEDDKVDIALELGDVLWFVSQLAQDMGFDLSDIAQANLLKLEARQQAGTLQGSGDRR